MKVTFILRNLSDVFFNGNGGSIVGLLSLSDADKFGKLLKCSHGDMRDCVSMKIGNDSFRDRVDLNIMLRSPCTYTFKIEPRRGYRLATFEITAE